MELDKLTNMPGTLKIEGIDSGGKPASLSIPICTSLPTSIGLALDRDLIELGKTMLTPHERLRPQLESLWRKMRAATDAKEQEAAEMFQASWRCLHDRMHDTIVSGKADDLAGEAYWIAGRRSVSGLHREIITRAKQQSEIIDIKQLAAVVNESNASLVLAQLQIALGEIADPTAAT